MTMTVMISEERLDKMWAAAVRDDMHTIIVPSDVRMLIKAIRELQQKVAKQQRANLKILPMGENPPAPPAKFRPDPPPAPPRI